MTSTDVSTTAHRVPQWVILLHQLPAEPAYLRVKIGRRLARVGAVALKNSVYILPATEACREDFSWTRREILDGGGEAMVLGATTIEGVTDTEVERMFRDARALDYAEVTSALRALKPKHLRDRAAALAEIAKLEERLRAVERIDFFSDGSATTLHGELTATRALLEQRTVHASESANRVLHVENYQGRTWVTRTGLKVDRVACAWLIRRFIDKQPKFRFVQAANYIPKRNELRFDMAEGEFTHVAGLCSFEVLCERFALRVPGLARIAEIVHDLDIKDGRYLHLEAEGIRVLIEGIVAQHTRDDARIAAGSLLFDTLLVASARERSGNGQRTGCV